MPVELPAQKKVSADIMFGFAYDAWCKMKLRLGVILVGSTIASVLHAQFVTGDLIVGIQATNGDAVVQEMDKSTGASGANVTLSGFRFNHSGFSGGIKTDPLHGNMYVPGFQTGNPSSFRVGRLTTGGVFDQAVLPNSVAGVAPVGIGTSFYMTQTNGQLISTGALNFDGTTMNGVTLMNGNTDYRLVTTFGTDPVALRSGGTNSTNGAFSGATGTTQISGFQPAWNVSPQDLWMSPDGLRLYMANNNPASVFKGVMRYSRANTSAFFGLDYHFLTPDSAASYVTAEVGLGGVYTIYTTSQEGDANRLFKIIDNNSGPGAASMLLATAPAGSRFTGVTIAPVPEPATIAALGLGLAAMLRRRKTNLIPQ